MESVISIEQALSRASASAGRLDGTLTGIDAPGIREAVLRRQQRDHAIRIASADGASTTPLRIEVAYCDVDADADRSARFASDVLSAVVQLASADDVGVDLLRDAFVATEVSSTPTSSSMVESEAEIVHSGFCEARSDFSEIVLVASGMRDGGRVRRRLASLLLPHVLSAYFDVRFPLYVGLPQNLEDADGVDLPGFISEIAALCDAGVRSASSFGLMRRAASSRIGQPREESRLLDVYVEMLATPVVTPRLLAPRLGITTRSASILISRLEAIGLIGTMPSNRLARKIGICENSLVPSS